MYNYNQKLYKQPPENPAQQQQNHTKTEPTNHN